MNSSVPRILIVVNVFRPDLGGGVLFADMVDGLAERGFKVAVKCAIPYYPQWADVSGSNGLQIETEIHHGYPVERHGLFIPSKPNSFFQRMIYEASFFLSLLRRRPKKDEFDVIMVFSPLIGSVGYATWVGSRSGIPVWLNVQDLSAQAASAGGISSGGFATRLLVGVQNAVFRKAKFWSSISQPMVDTLKDIPDAPAEVRLLPNWLHVSLQEHIASFATHPKPKLGSKIKLLYSGNIGGKQHLVAFCEQLHATALDFTFRIQGDGARVGDLKTWIAQTGDARFELHPLSDEAGLAQALHDADFYVITEKPAAGNSFIPSKLIPGISSGTPILAVCDADGPVGQEVSEFDLGLQVSWSDLSSLELFLSDVVKNPERHSKWQESALKRSEFYNRANGIERCAEFINHIMESTSKGKN